MKTLTKTIKYIIYLLIIIGIIYLIIISLRSNNNHVMQQHNSKLKYPKHNNINIRANMWPYPNSISRSDTSSVTYIDIPNEMSSFNRYVSELDKGCDNPLSDFNQYIKSIQQSKNSKSVPLSFDVEMKRNSFNLGDRTKNTYQADESYSLRISTEGRVSINAETYIGVGYAITALQQLISTDEEGHCFIRALPINISDSPNSFRRDTMLDTARNYFSTDSICSLIKVMGYNKLNKFDWHVTDCQSFPLDIGPISKLFSVTPSTDPNFLGMIGAFDENKTYSVDDVKRVIGTARNYGITVQPGIDTPGHCSALMYGSKQATKTVCNLDEGFQMIKGWEYNYQNSTNAPEPIVGYLDLGVTKTDNIVKVIHTLMDEIHTVFEFDSGRYGKSYNLNADEVNKNILSLGSQTSYLNKVLDIFVTDPKWKDVSIALWIDSVLSCNVSPFVNGTSKYNDNIQLKRFNGRLCLGLWNMWPSSKIENLTAITTYIDQIELVNYNSNYLYLDAGASNPVYSGYTMQVNGKKPGEILTHTNAYWISASPMVANQWKADARS